MGANNDCCWDGKGGGGPSNLNAAKKGKNIQATRHQSVADEEDKQNDTFIDILNDKAYILIVVNKEL